MVRLYRAALANDAASREYFELVQHHRDLLADAQSRMNGVELLQMIGWMDVVSSTSTNLVIKFKHPEFHVTHNGTVRGSIEYMSNDEALILTPDQGASIGEHHIRIIFIPVSLKKKRNGFQIINQFDARSFGKDLMRDTGYFALGDILTPASEDDVEMIMENGEWKKFERDVEATASPSSREKTVTATNGETPVNIAEDEPSEGKSKATTLWLYAIIPLCLLAVLWVVKRRRKRDSP